MEKFRIESVYFKKLKGLHDVKITFSKTLTAIMGVNGVGKTTVIHALACLYQPDGKGENYKFPYFFTPTTDTTWKDSELEVVSSVPAREGRCNILPSRTYRKSFDRWAPRYRDRPKRNVYYIGIDSCLPEIERTTTISVINYTTEKQHDNISEKVIKLAAIILNKNYNVLTSNTFKQKSLIGVSTKDNLHYSSLSMGTGEQRVIKMLEIILSAEAYSLILIDEIDLLLHVSALRRLIINLYKIAVDHHLQIVFTTHSLEILKMNQYVHIQYLHAIHSLNGSENIFVYDEVNDNLIRDLTGDSTHPIKVYVEDELSEAIVKTIAGKHRIRQKLQIVRFGAAHNAFTLAAGIVLKREDTKNILIILDGDEYATKEGKVEQIKSALSGTENDIKRRQDLALSLISQYELPPNTNPEEFIFLLLKKFQNANANNEIIEVASQLQVVDNKHEYIKQICTQLQMSTETVIEKIVDIISMTEEWKTYTSPIDTWIEARKDI